MIVITVARKPCEGTVAENAQKWGVAGLNIEGGRIGTTKEVPASMSKNRAGKGIFGAFAVHDGGPGQDPNVGRWPANLILDDNPEVLAGFPQVTSGMRDNRNNKPYSSPAGWKGTNVGGVYQKSSGSAARFFKQVKS